MTANLPPHEREVNDDSDALTITLDLSTHDDRAVELIREVEAYYHPAVPFPEQLKRLYALLCINAIDDAIKRRECLCLRCCTLRAGESAWALFAMRAEVLYRTGRSCLRTPHSPARAWQ